MKFFATSTKNGKILKLCSIGIALLVISALIIVHDPFQILVDTQLTLKAGTLLYNLWLKPPLDVFVTAYVFNVTNWEAFKNGTDKKLKVEEIGPYVYQELLENHNVSFNANNTMTYNPRRTVKFIRERSIGDPMVDRITAPNIPYMGIVSAATGFSTIAGIAMNALTAKFNAQPMLKMSVHEYLWGYDDPLVKFAAKIMPKVITFSRFGLMERMFDEGHNMVTIKLPPKDLKAAIEPELKEEAETARDFSIDNWNGGHGIRMWNYKENENNSNTVCNTLSGTFDGTLFPRQINKGETFRVYRKAFCRTMPIVYTHAAKINGIEGYNFKLHENAFDSSVGDANTACFCKNKRCLKKGLGNITPCYYNIPLAVSFPHFFNGDPSLLEWIEGLSPNESKHGTEIFIQPQLGIPMRVHSRFQLNLLMGDIKYSRDLALFRNQVVPIFWLEMSIEDLTPCLRLLLIMLFKVGPCLQVALVVALIIASIYMVGAALLYCFWMPASWKALNTTMEQMEPSKATMTNVCILPLLKQSQQQAKELMLLPQQRKHEFEVKLLPSEKESKKGGIV